MNSTAWRRTGNCNELHFVGGGGVGGGFTWFSRPQWHGDQRFAGWADVLYDDGHSGARPGLSEPTVQLPDDVSLLRSIADGDSDALRQLYERHNGMLFSLSLKTLGERADAEDVLQDTFIQVWKTAGSFDERRGKPLGWLIMLTRSRAIDRLRTRQTRARISETVAQKDPDAPALPAQQLAASETHVVVRRALETLPTDQRSPIELAYFGGLTQTEIAQRLGEPLGTIKTRMRTGMIRLREQLAGSAGAAQEGLRP